MMSLVLERVFSEFPNRNSLVAIFLPRENDETPSMKFLIFYETKSLKRSVTKRENKSDQRNEADLKTWRPFVLYICLCYVEFLKALSKRES